MYGMPRDLDLQCIVGCDLNQISLGRYDVQFVFGKTTIAVQSRASCKAGGEVVATWTEGAGWDQLAYQGLLNATVQAYVVLDGKALQIEFSNGFELHLYDDSDRFETMQIYCPDDPNGPIII